MKVIMLAKWWLLIHDKCDFIGCVNTYARYFALESHTKVCRIQFFVQYLSKIWQNIGSNLPANVFIQHFAFEWTWFTIDSFISQRQQIMFFRNFPWSPIASIVLVVYIWIYIWAGKAKQPKWQPVGNRGTQLLRVQNHLLIFTTYLRKDHLTQHVLLNQCSKLNTWYWRTRCHKRWQKYLFHGISTMSRKRWQFERIWRNVTHLKTPTS